MFLASYDGPSSDEYEADYPYDVSCSMSWPSSDFDASEVPQSNLRVANMKQRGGSGEQGTDAHRASAKSGQRRNPLPSSGSRRDACGCWSAGSDGHESGLCNGPCKDLRSGRGCTFGKKCKMCHLPHPEVSSTSIRSKKSRANQRIEQLDAMGLYRPQQMEHPIQSGITRGQSTTCLDVASRTRRTITTFSL